ncbi:hypothetical protein IB227_02125 [Stenotrophomonas sp. STM01]|uniref:host specificity factor TipJ family phage tail protein n=1 Tax=Stenotrophomonas sp. STM01 TaxID=2769278 RepID=UPI00177D808A|nr:host specificity factor TipJ family phage tail protein [Stenotrophomonas sp. STM01]MBD9534646.1 hypothetical protein [Stenotrophomonas sp. STM01]
MGLMELPRTEPGQLIVTPHPALLDGQRNTVWEARPGESLYALLVRNVPELDGQPWEVSVGGREVERHLWHHVYPKAGQVIEVRGGVGRSALAVVAMIALTYFTFGGGAIAGFTLGTSTALGTLAVQSAVYIAGSMLINKVLAPKPPKAVGQQQDSVYSITGARNQLRPYDPLPLLFGRVRLTPDLLSKPYTWYEGNDQYLGMLLCAGINVGRVEEFYNGDTLLSTYEGAQVFHAGYSQMPEQAIPLYSNADVIDGGQLIDTGSDPKHQPSAWVERTGSADTVRLVVAIEYQLYDKTSKGKDKNNTERVEIQYRPTGTTSWLSFGSYTLNSNKTKLHRVGYAKDVARGQYDVRVRTAGLNTNGSGAQAVFAWTTLTSVQVDEADYTGISRTGVKLKATGQLNGSPDELRAIGHADPIPVWTGTEWATQETSNPGAQILAYARGIVREGRLLGGMALSDAQIDIESLKAFSLHCAANGYRYDFLIKDARNHDQVLAAIALAGFGQITWAGGRLGVVWAAQEQPLSGVVNMATIKKGQFQVDYTLSNAADGIEYTYADGTTWETKTIRVPAPGVTTMLNPAQVTGEGVTTEEHAARLARWHLAQSLYQYKDISYSTDIEHLSYQRLSLLAMQHDMTQWGVGGRIVAATSSGGVVTLHLDEPVPAPASGGAYIGLRIPGERVYRVLRVKPFTGQSDTVELQDAWPADAALPGGTPDNPPDDTLWIYDFKQTPGLRVRVVSVEPESDLKGASVRVVAEGPEFWNYVLTGHYVPSPDGSLLQTRPVASNVAITEQLVVQGNTSFTELTATFDISGPVSNIVVRAAGEGQELRDVAQTQTRTATWRIPEAGTYAIVVRPYSPDGEAGVAASVSYTTAGADVPPVLVDLFDVQSGSGGVRQYTWGWLEGTLQSPDFAGVEIRYVAGLLASPDWDLMKPVGKDGYHTAAFEAVEPVAGEWTFACRSRNTSGELSVGMRVITRTLTHNLGEQIGGIGDSLEEITRKQAEEQARLDAEIRDRALEDLQYAQQAAADATAKANAARDEAIARVDALAGEIGEIVNAPEWSETEDYIAGWLVREGGNLYRANVANTNVRPSTNPATWEYIGQFASVAEAAAAALQLATTTALELEAEALRVDSLQARMPAGTGMLETKARVDQVDQASVDRDGALGLRVGNVEATIPDLATKASVTAVEQASVTRDNAMADSLTSVRSAIGDIATIQNPSFEAITGNIGWGTVETSPSNNQLPPSSTFFDGSAANGRYSMRFNGDAANPNRTLFNAQVFEIRNSKRVYLSLDSQTAGTAPAAGTQIRVGVRFYDTTGTALPNQWLPWITTTTGGWVWGSRIMSGWVDVPAGAATGKVMIYIGNHTAVGSGILVDNAVCEVESAQGVITAAAISGLTTDVSSIDGRVTTQAQQIGQVKVTADGASAAITNLSEVSIASNAIVTLDGGFETDKAWGFSTGVVDTYSYGMPLYSDLSTANARSGRCLRMLVGFSNLVYNQRHIRVSQGQKFRCTFWVRAQGSVATAGYVRISASAWNNSRQYTTHYDTDAYVALPGLDYNYRKVTGVWEVPAGVSFLQFCVRCSNIGNPNTYVLVDDVQIELLSEEQNVIRARNTVGVDVNGRWVGTITENDGLRGGTTFVMDYFRLLAADGASASMEITGNYLRVFNANYQKIIGVGFGVGGALMEWFGPNIGAANCTTANCIECKTTAGVAIIRGSNAQGSMEIINTLVTIRDNNNVKRVEFGLLVD